MAEHLVAGEPARAGDLPGLLEVADVEVAHAPRENLPLAVELLEGGKGVLERMGTSPVAIQPIGAEAGERSLAGRPHAAPGGVRGQDLGNQEDLVASPGDGLADQSLDAARSVHLRGIDLVMPRPSRSAATVAVRWPSSRYQVPCR